MFKIHQTITYLASKNRPLGLLYIALFCCKFNSIIHSFSVTSSKVGLLELAKDIARLKADSIGLNLLRGIVKPDKEHKLGYLKLMEQFHALSGGYDVKFHL